MKGMITLTITFKDSLVREMQLEEILHPFLLMANRKQFKDYVLDAKIHWKSEQLCKEEIE